MTRFAFPPHDPVSLPIVGSDLRFPVRRIYCIGRNYAAHVREMGADPARSEPIIFTKAAEALVENGVAERHGRTDFALAGCKGRRGAKAIGTLRCGYDFIVARARCRPFL